jgi:hypothetical protein
VNIDNCARDHSMIIGISKAWPLTRTARLQVLRVGVRSSPYPSR